MPESLEAEALDIIADSKELLIKEGGIRNMLELGKESDEVAFTLIQSILENTRNERVISDLQPILNKHKQSWEEALATTNDTLNLVQSSLDVLELDQNPENLQQ